MAQEIETVPLRKSFLLMVTLVMLGLSHAMELNSYFESPFQYANCLPTEVLSKLQCASRCSQRYVCVGFFYYKDESACLQINPSASSDCTYYNSLNTWTSWKKRLVGWCSEYLVPNVPDNQITASSDGSASNPGLDLRPRYARLGGEPHTTSDGLLAVGTWWTRQYSLNEEPWIQIQFNSASVVNGFTTQGRYYDSTSPTYHGYDERVTKYNIRYSDECSKFTSILDTDGQIRSFVGNTIPNSNAIHTNMLEFPIYALCVRLYPTERSVYATSANSLSMRLDVVGCEYN